MAGAPPKLTPQMQARIVELLKLGTGRMRAARTAGIHEATFCRWMSEGQAEESGSKREFYEAVIRAEDDYHEELVRKVRDLAMNAGSEGVQLQAAKLVLERRYPDDWAQRQQVRHEGHDGGAVKVEGSVKVQPLLSDDQVRALREQPGALGEAIGALVEKRGA
jgi:hypothetical protein